MGGRDSVKMTAWIKPKSAHKKMVQRLLQVRAHLILCFRAEEKVEIIKDENGKTKIVPKKSPTGIHGWTPICEKNLPYELTASFLLTADAPGVPKPIKLQEQHRALFPLDKPITEESGQRLAAWAKGSTAAPQGGSASPAATSSLPGGAAGSSIDAEALAELRAEFAKCDVGAEKAFLKLTAKVYGTALERLEKLPAADIGDAREWLEARREHYPAAT